MTFTAECPFCRIMLGGVPEHHNGASIECPQCKSPFTLAAPLRPREPRAVHAVSDTAATTLTAPAAPVLFRAHHLRTGVDSSGGALSTDRIDEAASRVSGFAVASFFLSTMALLCASIPGASIVVLPLAGTGLVCGGISILSRRARQPGMMLSYAGLLVSVPVLAIAGFWPGMLGLPERGREVKQATETQTVYHFAREGIEHLGPRDTPWVDASKEAIQQSGMRVRIAAAAVKPVELKDAYGHSRRTDHCLVIGVRISNTGVDRFVDYRGWAGTNATDKEAPPGLCDNLGKSYGLRNFGTGWSVVGQVPRASIPMAKWVDDVLVFDAPAASIEYLHLELPCAAFGARGKLQLEIPRQMIAFP